MAETKQPGIEHLAPPRRDSSHQAIRRVLVTGADGFIGSALCDQLAIRGFQVRRAVRALSPNLARQDDLHAIGDLSAFADWRSLTSGVEAIMHLANRAHRAVRASRNEVELIRSINVGATVQLATSAARTGVRRFVYVSSVHVNGSSTAGVPFTEEDIPAPVGVYATSKWQAEQALRDIESSMGLPVTIVRPPLVYGPRVKGNMLTLLNLIGRRTPLPLGSIHNLRSFVAVANLADLLIRCVDHPAASGSLFLAADGEDVSTPDLVRMIASAMGARVRMPHVPTMALRMIAAVLGRRSAFESFAGSLQVSSAHARAALGWRPPVDLQHGIEVMTEWFLREQR